jgi:hypothetical protein
MNDLERTRGAELRDTFFALSDQPGVTSETRRKYLEAVDAIGDEPLGGALVVDGLSLAWHPTARHKLLRWVPASRLEASALRDSFASPPRAREAGVVAAFVDPRELSFRSFENIVPLDTHFEGAPLTLSFDKPERVGDGPLVHRLALRTGPATRALLDGLDGLGLYVPPLNACSRGGERLIFHASILAAALTDALKEALPKVMLKDFSHVNPVFRLNRFQPGDEPFHPHWDTPYVDAQRQQASRMTLLVYLTGGRGEPALRVGAGADAVELTALEPMTAVLFGQEHEHEGRAFTEGAKIFLRTELVFHERSWQHDESTAKLFSQACYLTGESVFQPELARWSDSYFNRVAAQRFGRGARGDRQREPFLHKTFRGVDFVTNGYDYWFAKPSTDRPGLPLRECAALALLDYFNAKLGQKPFRESCTSEVVFEDADDVTWVPGFLRARPSPTSPFGELDKESLFPEPERTNGACCPFHAWGSFNPMQHREIQDLYVKAQSFARAHLTPAPITMLGDDVELDPDRFRIEGGTIQILAGKALSPVNFAACWNAGGMPEYYLDVDVQVGVLQLLVPPILFDQAGDTTHLCLDFFRNGWLVDARRESVPIPMIRHFGDGDLDPDDLGEDEALPWFRAVPSTLARPSRGKKAAIFWTDTKPLSALFPDVDLELEEED